MTPAGVKGQPADRVTRRDPNDWTRRGQSCFVLAASTSTAKSTDPHLSGVAGYPGQGSWRGVFPCSAVGWPGELPRKVGRLVDERAQEPMKDYSFGVRLSPLAGTG